MPSLRQHLVLTPLPGEADLGLVDALAQLAFAVHGALGRMAAAHDLSVAQARLLGILRDRRPTINDLAAILALDKSSITGLVDRAEDRGLVRRVPSPIDGRSVQVVITAAGRGLIERATRDFETEVTELAADLDAVDRTRLSQIASRVVAADGRRRGFDVFDVG